MCDKDEGQYSRTCDHVYSYEKNVNKYGQKKFSPLKKVHEHQYVR